GDLLARGSEPRRVMAELFGKESGLNAGKGGRLHAADPHRNIMPVNGIVAASLPLAAGSAVASKLRRGPGATPCVFGDHAANAGVFHETLNVVGLWKLPILLVAINNSPPDSIAPVSEHTAARSLAALGAVHGIAAKEVEGADARAVYSEARAALEIV